jgi:putative flippase GtrA
MEFLRFALVGAAGFAVDAATLTLALAMGASVYTGRGFSYLSAATFTWAVNRSWTFPDSEEFFLRQWMKFMLANAMGGLINYGVYVALIAGSPRVFAAHPVLAVAAGSIAGLFVNFTLSKRFVFRS